ncbi:hypothetical protein BpHYR1_040141 [Brachionus plicatilis]|uniref:Uncharacterized protein n=1 Tax=Brachionus plicatilis TaxID=10195 RepID=A0A3M7SCQ5_BRAPC|nr:hypothetical protein BpHYR1_040141 [Brachionus plicatilis]
MIRKDVQVGILIIELKEVTLSLDLGELQNSNLKWVLVDQKLIELRKMFRDDDLSGKINKLNRVEQEQVQMNRFKFELKTKLKNVLKLYEMYCTDKVDNQKSNSKIS